MVTIISTVGKIFLSLFFTYNRIVFPEPPCCLVGQFDKPMSGLCSDIYHLWTRALNWPGEILEPFLYLLK